MIEIDSLGEESIRNLAFHRRHEIIVQTHKDGDITNPITMNGHNYANNIPVMIVDPNGHKGLSKSSNKGKIKTKPKAKKKATTPTQPKFGCNCFTAGTKVLTEDGEKNIEDIEVGDMVLAKSEFDADGELAYKEVTALYTNYRNDLIKLYIGDLLIETTDNHPFWVEGRGWVFADELKAGDKLQKADGSHLTIDKVEFVLLDEPVMVYNFTVEDYHTYYVTDLGIWVHNTNCWSPMTGKTLIDAAKKHGYSTTNYTTKNKQKVFYNSKNKTYISQDIGSGDGNGPHNGGVWKMAKSPEKLNSKATRMGTYDAKLNRIGD